MARLPIIEQRSRISGVGLGPGPTSDVGTQALGRAIQEVGRDAVTLKVDQAQKSWQLADSLARSVGELNTYRESLGSDDDFDTQGQRYVDKAKEIEERYGSELGGKGPIHKIWQGEFRRAAAAGELGVAVDAQKRKVEKVRTDLGNTMEQLAELSGVSPEQDDVVRGQALLAIEGNREAGNLSYAERDALLQRFDNATDETRVRRDMTADPLGAEQKMLTGDYPRLTGERRAVWQQRVSAAAESAERRQVADAEHQQRLAEHEQKLAGDEAAKSGDRLFAKGKLSPAWIEANRDTLSQQDYRYFYGVLRNPPGSDSAPGNVPLYADLRDRAGRGEDVRTDAREALVQGAIRASDYDRIVGEVEAERPGWRRAGETYLKAITGYSDLNPTPGAAQLWATVSDEWSQWSDQHKNATPDEARKAYLSIGESHQLADQSVKQITLPWPKYGVGSRAAIDLKATAARTRAAFDAGEITQDEYNRQAEIWKQWNDISPSTQAPP